MKTRQQTAAQLHPSIAPWWRWGWSGGVRKAVMGYTFFIAFWESSLNSQSVE